MPAELKNAIHIITGVNMIAYVSSKHIGVRCAVLWACVAVVTSFGCASVDNGDGRPIAQFYDAPYEEVWSALERHIFDDLHCVPKKVSRKRGIIETEWITRIDTDGIFRWRLKVDADKKKNGVLVTIEKRVEMRDEVSKSMNRYRRKEARAVEHRDTGWKKTSDQAGTIDEHYTAIEEKLKSPDTETQ